MQRLFGSLSRNMKNVPSATWAVRNKTANHYEAVNTTIKGRYFCGIASANTYTEVEAVLNERDSASSNPPAPCPLPDLKLFLHNLKMYLYFIDK